MTYDSDMLNVSFHHCLAAYSKVVIYGFGALGRDLYARYRERCPNMVVVDQFACVEGVNIVRPEALDIDKDWLVVNTVMDPVENGKVSSMFRMQWSTVNLMSCRDYLVLSHDQEKILLFQSTLPLTGYLKETGWLKAYCAGRSLDLEGNPIPWTTYAFIAFIEPRLHQGMSIFEFGAGSSTIWFSKRVGRVTSVEHDEQWFKNIRDNNAENISIHFQSLEYGGDYSRFVQERAELFDLIIVDGRDRVNCIIASCSQLSDGGVIVLDDAEREEYQPGVEWLIKTGFKRLDFWGIAPGVFNNKCTTVFYRDKNCIGI
ncbi:hypothetical protein [Aeromonas salmonicida]|uniref:hypothetical protein n=2 Tax=Aeromonas salmonicida TaxID=645 RepID=UPI00240E0CA7|nr:hypothetical protein [Aeromonas salmonicida]WFC14010.1 hypothetical protein L3V47_20335 [Aeromonas salmonicida]